MHLLISCNFASLERTPFSVRASFRSRAGICSCVNDSRVEISMVADKVAAALLILVTMTPVMAQSQGSNAPIALSMRPKSVKESVRIPIPRPRSASPLRVYEANAGTDTDCKDQVCWTVSSCLPGQNCPYKCQVRWHPCDRDKVTHLGE